MTLERFVFLPLPPGLHQRVPPLGRGWPTIPLKPVQLARLALPRLLKHTVPRALPLLHLVVSQPSLDAMLVYQEVGFSLPRKDPAVDAGFPNGELLGALLVPLRGQSLEDLQVYLPAGVVLEHADPELLLACALRGLTGELIAQVLNGFGFPVVS